MDNQEMQFADPAWRPPQERESNAATQNPQPYIPLPINDSADNHEQWQSASTQTSADQSYSDTSYTGYRGYQAPPLNRTRPYVRSQPRTQRNPFIWLIVAFIIMMMMMGGAFRTFDGFRPPDGGFRPSDGPMHMRLYDQPLQQFPVGMHPTIVINDPYGSVHIHAGGPANFVSVQTNQEGRGDVPPSIYQNDNNTLTVSVDSQGDASQVDIDVTVASDANLTVQTRDADIEVDDVTGQLSLTSDSGSINVSRVTLEGKSTLQDNSGSISFDGTIAPDGAYGFQSHSGSIDVTLPQDASFHGDVTTNSGSFNSDFPEVNIRPPDTHTAQGDVGNAPHPTVTIATDSGSIGLHKES